MKWPEIVKIHKIPIVYQNVTLNTHIGFSEIYDEGKIWLSSNPKKSLYIYGSTGCGKTYFAYALMRGLVDQGYDWIYFKRSDMLDNELLQASDERKDIYLIEKLTEVPFLFLDDLGVERCNERILKQYYAIIEGRVSNLMTTIITSNKPPERISENLGDRISSRLNTFEFINFPNIDHRKKLVKELIGMA